MLPDADGVGQWLHQRVPGQNSAFEMSTLILPFEAHLSANILFGCLWALQQTRQSPLCWVLVGTDNRHTQRSDFGNSPNLGGRGTPALPKGIRHSGQPAWVTPPTAMVGKAVPAGEIGQFSLPTLWTPAHWLVMKSIMREREKRCWGGSNNHSCKKSLENDHLDMSEQPGDTMSRDKSREVGGTVWDHLEYTPSCHLGSGAAGEAHGKVWEYRKQFFTVPPLYIDIPSSWYYLSSYFLLALWLSFSQIMHTQNVFQLYH